MKRSIVAMLGVGAALSLAGCSESDLAYFDEAMMLQNGGAWRDSYDASNVQCDTGYIVWEQGVSNNQRFDRAINRTQRTIEVNFKSAFGGGNAFTAGPGQTTETLWRSPVDARGATSEFDCNDE